MLAILQLNHARMQHADILVVDMRVFFILSTCLTILSICELVVDDTVDSKDNLEEKTREDAEIRMHHLGWNFLQLGRDI